MAERDKMFFKDGITDKFSEAVSRLNLSLHFMITNVCNKI